jgi:hypothetical protein
VPTALPATPVYSGLHRCKNVTIELSKYLRQWQNLPRVYFTVFA